MRKFARSGLILALLGLPVGSMTTGCSDNAGGNEDSTVNATKGTVPANAPQSPEEYYKQHKAGSK